MTEQDEKFLQECEAKGLACLVAKPGSELPNCHEKTICDCSVQRLIAMVRERDAKIRDLHLRFQLEVKLPKNLAFDMADARISTLESALRESLKTINEFGGIVSAHEDAIRSDSGNTNIQVWMEKLRAAREKIKGVLDGH